MKIIDHFKLNNGMTVICCEPFSDSQITKLIKVDGEIVSDFIVENLKECFSMAKTRNIVVREALPQQPRELLFV